MTAAGIDRVALLRQFYEDDRGFAPYAQYLAPDIEFDLTAIYPDLEVMRGPDALRAFLDDDSPWAGSLTFTPEEFIEAGPDTVIVLFTVRAVGESSGIPIEQKGAHEVTFRGDLVTRVRSTRDRERLLREAGIKR